MWWCGLRVVHRVLPGSLFNCSSESLANSNMCVCLNWLSLVELIPGPLSSVVT